MSRAALIEGIGPGAFEIFEALHHLLDQGVVATVEPESVE